MLKVPREIIATLEKYQQLVLKWNDVINLVSKSTIQDFWVRHIVDSLQLLEFIPNRDIELIDVGSGAGLPGIVLSIAGVRNVTIIEADSRKCAFLLQAAALSSNKIVVINQRVEDVKLTCDILTSRAFANLNKIFSCTANIKVRDKYLLLKGENYQTELKEACDNWSFDYLEHESATAVKSKILEIKLNER